MAQALGTITPDLIEATCKKHACNFFYLTDIAGTTRHVQIGNKTGLNKKIEEAIQTISALNENVFKIVFMKSTSGKDKAEYLYYLTKTPQTNTQPLSNNQPQTIINTPFEPARSMSEALKDAREVAELRSENKRLNEELNRLTIQLDELKSLKEEKPLEEGALSLGALGNFAKEILPQFLPLADRYFELAEKKIALQAMQLNAGPKQVPQQQRPKKQHPFRPIWNLTDTEKTEKYLTWLESIPQQIFDQELNFLQTNYPDLCNLVKETFADETIPENGNQENND